MVRHGSRVLLRGGSVYSPGAGSPTAMLVVDGQVAWLGTDTDAERHADSADTVVDLDGRLVTPGFVDAHVHLAPTGIALATVNLGGSNSLNEALGRLAAAATTQPEAVVHAHGWDETTWPEHRPPTRTEID